jgi:hypothetical protein
MWETIAKHALNTPAGVTGRGLSSRQMNSTATEQARRRLQARAWVCTVITGWRLHTASIYLENREAFMNVGSSDVLLPRLTASCRGFFSRTRITLGNALYRAANYWCYLAHPAPKWPRHGMYQCPRCGRFYPVPWRGDRFGGRDSQDWPPR